MTKLLSFFFGFIFLSASSAQDNCLERLDKEGIYLRSEFWRGLTMVKGTESKPVGFFFEKIKPEFDHTPNARQMFLKAQKNNKIAFAASLVGVAGIITGAAISANALDANGDVANRRNFNIGSGLTFGSAALVLVVSVPLGVSSERQLSDAVWARNREMMR
jgi:hypothetical protein